MFDFPFRKRTRLERERDEADLLNLIARYGPETRAKLIDWTQDKGLTARDRRHWRRLLLMLDSSDTRRKG